MRAEPHKGRHPSVGRGTQHHGEKQQVTCYEGLVENNGSAGLHIAPVQERDQAKCLPDRKQVEQRHREDERIEALAAKHRHRALPSGSACFFDTTATRCSSPTPPVSR